MPVSFDIDRAAICAAYRSGEGQQDIARRFGVSRTTVAQTIACLIPSAERDRLRYKRLLAGGVKRSRIVQTRNIDGGAFTLECVGNEVRATISGITFRFDRCDEMLLKSRAWRVAVDKFGRARLTRGLKNRGQRGTRYVYQEILGEMAPGLVVDHINRDTTDNRRCNLRVCTRQQNAQNTRPKTGKAVPFKGVSKKGSRYAAILKRPDGSVFREIHVTAEAAALAYDREASAAFGEFAWLNSHHFPQLAEGTGSDHV